MSIVGPCVARGPEEGPRVLRLGPPERIVDGVPPFLLGNEVLCLASLLKGVDEDLGFGAVHVAGDESRST